MPTNCTDVCVRVLKLQEQGWHYQVGNIWPTEGMCVAGCHVLFMHIWCYLYAVTSLFIQLPAKAATEQHAYAPQQHVDIKLLRGCYNKQ
jgi:hypothetical protein